MKYYVYVAYLDDSLVYIGRGQSDRYLHLNSGTSSSYIANKAHFEGKSVTVEFVKKGLTKEDSQELEIFLIKEADPPWNVAKPGRVVVRSIESRKTKNATSQYFGVSYWPKNKKHPWRSWVRLPGKRQHIGTRPTELDAAKARDEYVKANSLDSPLNFD